MNPSVDVFSPFHLVNLTTMLMRLHGERWRSRLKKSRASTATPTSMEWTSPVINSVLLSRSGTQLLRLSSKLKLPMVTSLECSLLLSPAVTGSKLKPPAMLNHHTKSNFAKRWWKSWLLRLLNQLLRMFSKRFFLNQSVSRFYLIAKRSSLLRMYLSARLRSSRSLSSILPSSWNFIKTSQKLLKLKLLPQPLRLPTLFLPEL